MRATFLVTAAAVGFLALPLRPVAAANTNQYCIQIHGKPFAWRCGYETLAACQTATDSGEGTCVRNRGSSRH